MQSKSKPLLSIVIANYNYGRFLEEAIRSVISQQMGNKVELIICDAASTDSSVDVIKKYANGLPAKTRYEDWRRTHPGPIEANAQLITWWCSEYDGGQSAAFNKGFTHSRGIWLTWLNADDLLLPGALKAFEKLTNNKPRAEWVTGNKVHFASDTRRVVSVHWGPHSQPPYMKGARAFSAVYGPTTFWKRSLYDRMGPIDENLHYAMDTEYWARFTMAGVFQIRLNRFCWGFRVHEESKTEGLQSDAVTQKRKAETRYWVDKLNYTYERSWKNIWYVMWLSWRLFDGSLLARTLYRKRFTGRLIDEIYK